jgi:signal transduction histidine kinase
MSVVADVVELPVRPALEDRGSLEHDFVLALATAADLRSGMEAVVGRVRRISGAARVEWWANGDDGVPELIAAVGTPRGTRHNLELDRAGVLVLHGASIDRQTESALALLAPIVRRREAEERLVRATIELARRNEALEDFAALVAHELKTPLQSALVADDPSVSLEDAIGLVDALLEASRSGAGEQSFASVPESLGQAVDDLRVELEITTYVTTALPLSPAALRVILRNLLSNAVAAGARHIHVVARHTSDSWYLFFDDDGVGLAATDRYNGGSGLGLSLCRRIAARFGGTVELSAAPGGGTRATLRFAEAS